VIDILDDNLLTLKQASNLLPGRPHISTIHRWRLRGVRGIKLSSVMIGGRRFTSRLAINSFIEQTTASRSDRRTPPDTSSNRSRERTISAAERQLEA
jgi:hypothetical protein